MDVDGDSFKLKGKSSIRILQLSELVCGLLHWINKKFTHLSSTGTLFLIKTDKEKKEQTLALVIDSIRLLLDIPVAFSFVYPGRVPPKAVGFCGTATSLISIYQLWK